jgi:hypothetical protein
VNALYEAGTVIVAASGDSFHFGLGDFATRFTVYPSAFNRVLTAVGVTYGKQPYITDKFSVMQGCWGPDDVMQKAIAAFTPNVAWMKCDDLPAGFEMSGGGTSASTPQIAAACALWLQRYGARLTTRDWRRVEACRLAIFTGADNTAPDFTKLGRGLLNVPRALEEGRADAVIADQLAQSPEDSVSSPFWRLLVGSGPPQSEQERMYEVEVEQVVRQSTNPYLAKAVSGTAALAVLGPTDIVQLRTMLNTEKISTALRQRLAAA